MSRDSIISNVKRNHAPQVGLPGLDIFPLPPRSEWKSRLVERLGLLHVEVVEGIDWQGAFDWAKAQAANGLRIVTTIAELKEAVTYIGAADTDPHLLEDVDLAIVPAHFAVAENGACWVTEDQMVHRVLPFIAQKLAIVINKNNIFYNMHQAYEAIDGIDTAFGVFIAGPSKTADIEQSLVLGAHGPKSMDFLLID